MDKNMSEIFSRLYQSYVTGGDTYTYQYKTDKPDEIESNKEAVRSLEEEGYLEILSMGDKKARVAITDKGIAYGNDNY